MNIFKHSDVNWAVVDQAVVSGANFLTGVILARLLGIEEFGKYALLFAILISGNYLQRAFIVAPMQIHVPQVADSAAQKDYLGGLLVVQFVYGAFFALCVYLAGLLVGGWFPAWGVDQYLAAFAICTVFYLQQDWLKRTQFAVDHARNAFINDTVSYGGQLVLIGILHVNGLLSVTTAYLAIAASSALATPVGLLAEKLAPAWQQARRAAGHCWEHGRHLALAWQMEWLGLHGVLLITGAVLGAPAAGAIRAAQNIVAPINVLFMAMDNVVPVQAARRLNRQGAAAAAKYLVRLGKYGAALLLAAFLITTLAAEWLMQVVYGPAFILFASLVIWQAVILFLKYQYLIAQYFFRVSGRTRELLSATLILTVATITGVILLISPFGVDGVMAGVAAGLVCSLAYLGYGILKHEKSN